MRELNVNEIEKVNGGGLVFGAVAGGASSYASGGDLGDVVAGAFMGGIAGFFGGAGAIIWGAGYRFTGAFLGGGGGAYFSSLRGLSKN
ncbi:hypothetical protein [Colwellia sp. PAMC 21821]|uniref:hypothetical protein n=1 Tax=Colwellia sp. PAMC 21821 TaxID=1816219 RepID=UPI0009C12AEE|nr:hypothetical protein [Colwellia sp. PAMC 21821]ARD43679.1 hypothetical protein A3Q33_04785 [Colwellia sp. PAMC 21821]